MHHQILVVDDDPVFRNILSSAMRWAGYHVQTAEHGAAALEALRATPGPMVVTLDLNMRRERSGIAILEAVAADAALAQRHAITLVTGAGGLARHGRMGELRNQLDIPLVEKPFALAHVLDVVRQAVQRVAI